MGVKRAIKNVKKLEIEYNLATIYF